jgi:hypothetical protein
LSLEDGEYFLSQASGFEGEVIQVPERPKGTKRNNKSVSHECEYCKELFRTYRNLSNHVLRNHIVHENITIEGTKVPIDQFYS